ILHADRAVDLFMDRRKAVPALAAHLGNEVRLDGNAGFGPALDALGAAKKQVQADPATAPAWVFQRLDKAGATVVKAADPCQEPKACKNDVELAGIRAAHLRDGAALARFLAWFMAAAPHGDLSEMAAADKLEEMRRIG